MELLDIVDEKGNPTGEVKERALIHRKGCFTGLPMYGSPEKIEKAGWICCCKKEAQERFSSPLLRYLFRAPYSGGLRLSESALRELEENWE